LAENIKNLPGGYDYYMRQIHGNDFNWIKVHLMGEYGSSFNGEPVYKHYWNERVHLAKDQLKPVSGLPLRMSFDWGYQNPACVIYQIMPNGRFFCFEEVIAENISMRDFCVSYVKPVLKDRFRMCRDIHITGDPAGLSHDAHSGMTSFQEIRSIFGVKPIPSPIQKPDDRIGAVCNYLKRMIDTETSGFMLDPSCVMLREGFNGGYHYAKVSTTGRDKPKPEKNEHSHCHDALQYACCDSDEGYESANVKRKKAGVQTTGGWGGAV